MDDLTAVCIGLSIGGAVIFAIMYIADKVFSHQRSYVFGLKPRNYVEQIAYEHLPIGFLHVAIIAVGSVCASILAFLAAVVSFYYDNKSAFDGILETIRHFLNR